MQVIVNTSARTLYRILYGIARDDVEYILTQFQGIVQEDEAHRETSGGVGATRRLILDCFDDLTSQIHQ